MSKKKLENINPDNLPVALSGIMQKELALKQETGSSLGIVKPEDTGGFLTGLKYAWGIQNFSKTNFFFLCDGEPAENESNMGWLDRPFRVSVLFAKDMMRRVVEDEEGNKKYEQAYSKGQSEKEFVEMLTEFKEGGPNLQQGATFCVAVITEDGQVSIADLTVTKTLYKGSYNTLCQALFQEAACAEFKEPNCRAIMAKSKAGNLFVDRSRFEGHVAVSRLTADEAAAIGEAMRANEKKIAVWYAK